MTNALAIVAVLISTGAGVIALLARSDSRSQARTAAESLAELRTQQHEAYRPLQPCEPEFVAEPHPRTGKDSLFFVFTPTRSYRIAGDALHDVRGQGSRSPLSLSPVVEAGMPVRIFVGEMTGAADRPCRSH